MANGIYKVIVEVQNAPSGSERLGDQQGEPIERATPDVMQDEKTKAEKPRSIFSAENTKRLKNTAATGVTLGYAGLRMYEQNAAFKGDSNRVTKINETKKWVGKGAVGAGLLATGNILGAGIYMAWTAYDLALENRAIISERENDRFSSNFYQERLVIDITKRSR